MRGYRISISVSMPSEMHTKVSEFRQENRMNQSEAICRLIRLGLTYTLLLEEQKTLDEVKPKVKPKKKKTKPKTPSK